MNPIAALAVKVVTLLGGASWIVAEIRANSGKAALFGLEQLEGNPAAEAWIRAHRSQILTVLGVVQQADQAVAQKLQSEATQPPAAK